MTAVEVKKRGGIWPRSRRSRAVVWGLLVALVVSLFAGVFAGQASADDDQNDYSLYNLASNTANYFNKENAPGEGGKEKPEERIADASGQWQTIAASPATGGDFLGYADPSFSWFDVTGWLYSMATGSTQTVKYDSLDVSGTDGSKVYEGILDYAHFGATLSDLNLDSMAPGFAGAMVRVAGGGLMLIAFTLSSAVDIVFLGLLKLLRVFNPFGWFFTAVGADSQTLAHGMIDGRVSDVQKFSGIQNFIASWYGTITSFSWGVMVPLFVAVLVGSLLLSKSAKKNKSSKIRNFFLRLVYIGLGLPLLGSLYTGILNDAIDDFSQGSSTGPTKVIASTFVDFDKWMTSSRLAVPDGATIEWGGDGASSSSVMKAGDTAEAINYMIYSDFQAPNAADMLLRFIRNETVTASDFEADTKDQISAISMDNVEKEYWFAVDTQHGKDTYGDEKGYGGDDGDEDMYGPTHHPLFAVNGGGLYMDGNAFKTSDPVTNCTVWSGGSPKDDGHPTACNMSALSAYNYLNTKFDSNSLTLFSSNNVTSGLTREDHAAVSLVGSGINGFFNWASAFSTLLAVTVVGFWYAFGMIFGSIRKGFKILASVPFATFGALKSIAQVIVYSLALVCEVFLTLLVYDVVTEMLIGMKDIMLPIANSVSSGPGVFQFLLAIIAPLLSTILTLVFAFLMLKVRKDVVKGAEEMLTKFVEKFTDQSITPPSSGGNLGGALAAGAGAGAGMALGSQVASSLGGKSGGGFGTNPGKGGEAPQQSAGGTAAVSTSKTGELPPGGTGPDAVEGGPKGPEGLPPGSGGSPRGSGAPDDGGPLELTSGEGPDTTVNQTGEKAEAEKVIENGGLSNPGYDVTGGRGQNGQKGTTGQAGRHGTSADHPEASAGGTSPTGGSDGQSGKGSDSSGQRQQQSHGAKPGENPGRASDAAPSQSSGPRQGTPQAGGHGSAPSTRFNPAASVSGTGVTGQRTTGSQSASAGANIPAAGGTSGHQQAPSGQRVPSAAPHRTAAAPSPALTGEIVSGNVGPQTRPQQARTVSSQPLPTSDPAPRQRVRQDLPSGVQAAGQQAASTTKAKYEEDKNKKK